MGYIRILGVLLFLATAGAAIGAYDRDSYYREASTRDVRLFLSLDRDGDGALTREESKGDLNLGPRFDDIDIDRDRVVTREELERYIRKRYGLDVSLSEAR